MTHTMRSPVYFFAAFLAGIFIILLPGLTKAEQPKTTTEPDSPSNIRAWTGYKKSHEIGELERTNETTPYFTWSGPSGSDISYAVYFGTDQDADPVEDGTEQTGRSYSVSDETILENQNGKDFYFIVKTLQDGEESSRESFSYHADTVVDDAPDLTLASAAGGIRVLWNGSDNDIYFEEYYVLRSNSQEGPSEIIKQTTNTLIDDFIDTNVYDNTPYYYYLLQVDDLGNVSEASTVSIWYQAREWILTGAGPGKEPLVKLYERESNGETDFEREFHAYDKSFTGGVNVAACDLDGDGHDEIVTGTGVGGGPQVRVFDQYGTPKLTNGFFAYGENFRGGVYVDCGDLDGDGFGEIVTGTGFGGGPQVRTFDGLGNVIFTPGFFAYGENFRGGVTIALGDLDGDGDEDIITGTGPTGGPQVRTFDGYGNIIHTVGFFAYDSNFRGGVRVGAADVDADGKAEIVTVPGEGGGPHVRVFNNQGTALNAGFMAFESTYRGGVYVSNYDIDQDGADEIVVGSGTYSNPVVATYSKDGVLEHNFYAYNDNWIHGVVVDSFIP